MLFKDCLTVLMPMARARLEGNRLGPDCLLDVPFLYGNSPLLVAYGDLLSPGFLRQNGRLSLEWEGYRLEIADGSSADITELIGQTGPDTLPSEAISGIVAHFWTLGLLARRLPGRFLGEPSGLLVSYEPLCDADEIFRSGVLPSHPPVTRPRGVDGLGRGSSGGSGSVSVEPGWPLAITTRRIEAQVRRAFNLSASQQGDVLRELRSVEGDTLLLPAYASLLAPVIDLSSPTSEMTFLYGETSYDPFHVDLLHGHATHESEIFLRAAGETIAYFWNLQLWVTGQEGRYVVDDSDVMDVALAPDEGLVSPPAEGNATDG